MAIRDHNGDERPSRLGYFAAIFVSALGHGAIFIFVFFIAPHFLQAPQAAPPSYTVKIVDNVLAGDLGTHLPPINKHPAEKSKPAASKPQEAKVKTEPPKNALAFNDTSKNALRVNAPTVAQTDTPTPTPEPAPSPEPTVEPKSLEPPIEATEQPSVEPTPSPEPTKRAKKRPSPKPTPEKANRPKAGSTVARVASTPTVAQRMEKLRQKLMAEHIKELAKNEPGDEGEDPDEPATDENPAKDEEGGGPVGANVPPSEGKGYGVGPGEGSVGILKDPEFLLYYKTVQDQIKKSWTFTSGSNDLTATVDFAIGPDGALHNLKIGTSSNDSAFDDSVLRAVRRAAPFPAPPEKFRDLFSSGIEAQFELGELKS